MGKLNELMDFYPDEKLLAADGFEDALIGVAYDKATSAYRLVYSISKCIDILIERDGMTGEEAQEFFGFNIQDAYVGEHTPIWVDDEMFTTEIIPVINEGNENFRTFDDIETNDGEHDE
jgi:hypothetical protein